MMPKDFLVSVIVPVYNSEEYLEALVWSILSQTYENIEVVLVNDGSTDRSLQICENIALKDKRVLVKTIENSGSSVARNTGIAMSKGEYIMFADSDDIVDTSIVEELLEAVLQNDVKVAVALGKKTTIDGFSTKTSDIVDGTTRVLSGEEKLLFIFNHVAPWAKLYHRSIFDKFEFRKGIIHQDFDLIPKIVFEQEKIACVSKQLYTYIVRDNSITEVNKKKRKPDLYTIIDFSIEKYYPLCKERPDAELFIAEYLRHGFVRFKSVIARRQRKEQQIFIKAYCNCYRKWKGVISQNKKLSRNEKFFMRLGANTPRLFEFICRSYLKLKRDKTN